jgi:ATP-dependent exoDNAse (exonuclease V) alpha subunit
MSSKKVSEKNSDLSPEQALALELLESGENVFLTGGAGSGKSHLIRTFTGQNSSKSASKLFPILASTGAAAVLIGGRTFHSFFGLGIMEGGLEATVRKAANDRRVMKRVSDIEGFILDEVSMIPAAAFEAAELITRAARGSSLPWGGLRVIVVGDFAQLPPVTRTGTRDWAFKSSAWLESGFQIQMLTHNHRVEDREFLDVLADARVGKVTERVSEFLNEHVRHHDPDDKATRLFPRRDQSENFNLSELKQINEEATVIDSIYLGESRYIESLQKQAPIPNQLVLKPGCKVLFLQNDPQKRWVNGTRGTVVNIAPDKITVEKDGSHRDLAVEKTMFSLMDAEGQVKASVLNFPLSLAYATTIHKSQGATLDELWVDLSRLWEPGHAYVALSRLKSASGLRVLGWSPKSFVVDPMVNRFYEKLMR